MSDHRQELQDMAKAIEEALNEIAILREALERIAKFMASTYEGHHLVAIARDALLRAGRGEERCEHCDIRHGKDEECPPMRHWATQPAPKPEEHPTPMPSYEDEHGIKRHATPLTAPNPEGRSCDNCDHKGEAGLSGYYQAQTEETL